MDYGRAIRVVRAVKNVSQKDLADAARPKKLDQSHVSRIESGKRKPSEEVLSAIANGLEVPRLLLTLLASEPRDFRGIPHQKMAQDMGVALAELLFEFKDAEG